jgi:hypothetical protein
MAGRGEERVMCVMCMRSQAAYVVATSPHTGDVHRRAGEPASPTARHVLDVIVESDCQTE